MTGDAASGRLACPRSSEPGWLEAVRAHLAAAGLDLVHAGSTRGWHDAAAPLPADRLALVVGNSRALWPALEAALPRGGAPDDPIDRHVERALAAALAETPLLALHLAHRPHPETGAFFPVQRVAAHLGFAHLSPAHLLVHRQHGPWVAVRAVAVFAVDASGENAPAPDPCRGCSAPCVPALQRALAATDAAAAPKHASGAAPLPAALAAAARAVWPVWVEVRDACPEGRAARYPPAMLRYHHSGQGWPAPPAVSPEASPPAPPATGPGRPPVL